MKSAVFVALFALGLAQSGCQETASAQAKEKDEQGQTDADRPKAKSSALPGVALSAAPATPPEPAPIAAVRQGKMISPATKKEVPLVETSLDKCYGFKGYSMKLPQGSKLTTLVGARACAVELPDSKGDLGFIVMTDEVKVKWWKRTELENVKTKLLDDADAFLYEVENKGKLQALGWMDKKLGPHNVRCNALDNKDTMTLDETRAAIEICRTMKYEEPKKK